MSIEGSDRVVSPLCSLLLKTEVKHISEVLLFYIKKFRFSRQLFSEDSNIILYKKNHPVVAKLINVDRWRDTCDEAHKCFL